MIRKPYWLKSEKLGTKKTSDITRMLRKFKLHTVCESAKCPNRGECFDRGTATFMILGDVCTRNCSFCAVGKNRKPLPVDPNEPENIARLSKELQLKHIVITTVTRDDLPDGGAGHFAKTVKKIREICASQVSIEVLISDLKGDLSDLKTILDSCPDIVNHNVETIPRLYSQVRQMANFDRSLKILEKAKEDQNIELTKSGFMVGLGETDEEVTELLKKLKDAKVDIVTIGQYMQPSKEYFSVKRYVEPKIFEEYRKQGLAMGFKLVESAPLVRSSYKAEKARKYLTRLSKQ
ncbi:MAG: lipoyl synthase [Candidatus Cloacimonadota bacterium]|nr:lipoyl synthase [Candidatus Cloacimonadota bacterium]